MTDREVTLAALAGTAVDRLFLGGPFHGQVHTVDPDAGPVLAQWAKNLAWIPAVGPEPAVAEYDLITYMPRLIRIGIWSRTVMIVSTIADPTQELTDWLLVSWIMEAPEGR